MSSEVRPKVQLEIAHILFIDVVGYSKLLIDDQHELQEQLNGIVRNTAPFRVAEAENKLVRLPTGDGMALVFFTNAEAPVECAMEISEALRGNAQLQTRMGINTGPVSTVADVNDRPNFAGAGINIAQRVMDVGDAGHILLSKRAAEDLIHYRQWQPHFHDLGEVEVKHGTKIAIVNFYTETVGNPRVPEKIKEKARQQAARRRGKQRLLMAGLLASAALIVAGLLISRRVQPTLLPEKSIAVLPFASFDSQVQDSYFADGVQDDILTDLTKVADLKVISRRSVAQFRDTKKTIREIGQALQVAHLLEGSVRKTAGRIHITVQLIDTRSERQTWAEKYERDIADVFDIQSEISQTIVTQLKAALSPTEKSGIEEKPTNDQETYDLYLRARSLVYEFGFGVTVKMGEENTTKAIVLLEQAIARDPQFTLAYCVLGDARLNLYQTGYSDRVHLVKAKEAIDTALRISPNSPEAHLTLAGYFLRGLHDARPAEKELAIAAAGLPGRVDVFNLRAAVEERRGQWKEALRDREKAVELDPRDSETAFDLANLYTNLRRYPHAERVLDRMIASLPQQSTSSFWRGKSSIALAQGNTNAAMAALDASPNRHIGLVGLNSSIANVFVMERNYAKAEEILRSVEETAKTHNVLPKHGNPSYTRGHTSEQLGRIARFKGENEKARSYFEAARPIFEEWLAKNPEQSSEWEARALAFIAEIDAGLGRKEDAIREGRHAVELWPFTRDATIAPDIATLLAIVYVWSGEREPALQQLAELAKLPGGPTAGDLKLNPIWDELRPDRRFDKIVADAAVPLLVDPHVR